MVAYLILSLANLAAPVVMALNMLVSPRPNRCRRQWLRFMAANRIAIKEIKFAE